MLHVSIALQVIHKLILFLLLYSSYFYLILNLPFINFIDIPTNVFGETLQKQVEDRLKFYESGDLPPKNADVMHEAVAKAEEAKSKILKREKKKKKKSKKSMDTEEGGDEAQNGENGNCQIKKFKSAI